MTAPRCSDPKIPQGSQTCRIALLKVLTLIGCFQLSESFSNVSSTIVTYFAEDGGVSRNNISIHDSTVANSVLSGKNSSLTENINKNFSITSTLFSTRGVASDDKPMTVGDGDRLPVFSSTHLAPLSYRYSSSQENGQNVNNNVSNVNQATQTFPGNSQFLIQPEKCQNDAVFTIYGEQGDIFLTDFPDNSTFDHVRLNCELKVTVPSDRVILITFGNDNSYTCDQGLHIFPYVVRQVFGGDVYWTCHYDIFPILTVAGNTVNLKVSLASNEYPSLKTWNNGLMFSARFEAKPDFDQLPVVYTSPLSGFVTSLGYDGETPYARGVVAFADVIPPTGHVTMLSFPSFEINKAFSFECEQNISVANLNDVDQVSLYELQNRSLISLWSLCGIQYIETTVYSRPLRVHFSSLGLSQISLGFKAVFSFHKASEAPEKLSNGLWNCSAPYYSAFKQHLECNLEPECQGGEDEGPHCRFTSLACNGSVAFENKCFTYVTWHKKLSWDQANTECTNRGAKLVSLASLEKRRAFRQIYERGKKRRPAYVGLRTVIDKALPNLYKDMWQWQDKVIAHGFNVTFYGLSYVLYRICGYFDLSFSRAFFAVDCESAFLFDFVCEQDVSSPVSPRQQVQFPKATITTNPLGFPPSMVMATCPNGHLTLNFLSCDVASHCGVTTSKKVCQVTGGGSVAMFTCGVTGETIPYTLVCDYRPDCPTGADEKFCVYNVTCKEKTCRNGQCIRYAEMCDGIEQCVDKSDEDSCSFAKYTSSTRRYVYAYSPPALINVDSTGTFVNTKLRNFDLCPETHFLCPQSYCLPVFLRCNGVYDCPDKEDENDCQSYTCPGLYRCRGSSVCVHAEHLCDGVFHCPQQDDEWMCVRAVVCPESCLCQGLAFVCSRYFQVSAYPELRYVDVSGSRMKLELFVNNLYLVYLNLSKCQLETLNGIPNCPNLQILDLSDNLLDTVNLDIFVGLNNLQNLSLAGNPINFLSVDVLRIFHPKLQSLDLSRTKLLEFDSYSVASFPNLKILSLSECPIYTLPQNTFRYLPHLAVLDLSKTSIRTFSFSVLKELKDLSSAFSSNPRLCCDAVLPEAFDIRSCFTPLDPLSSCSDLLHHPWHRIFLWMFTLLCFLGNGFCLLLRYLLHSEIAREPFDVFVTSLNVANMLTGVHLALVCASDLVLKGDFLLYEATWRTSTSCKSGRFLSVLSTQASVFCIFFLAVDRFLALLKPSPNVYFQRKSAAIVCGGFWFVAVLLAFVAVFLTSTTEDFTTFSNLCLPFLLGIYDHQDPGIFFLVLYIFNLLLLSLAALGQVAIYRSAHKVLLISDKSCASENKFMARRLFSLVWTDFLSWLAASVAAFLKVSHNKVSDDAVVAFGIFVLPFSSAMNPLIYIYNLVAEERLKGDQLKIVRWLQSRAPTQKTNLSQSSSSGCTIDAALKIVRRSLEQKSVEVSDIEKYIATSRKEFADKS